MPTLSITTTTSEATRMQVALGKAQSLGRNATAAEVKAFWITQMKLFVLGVERREAKESYEANLTDTAFDPT